MMKKLIRFRDIEQITYSLIGFIPYLLALYLIIYLDAEITTPLLLIGLCVLVAHLIGYSVIRRFGRQLRDVYLVTGKAAMSDEKQSIEVSENTPDELVGIVQHFNTVLADSERTSRNFQEMTTKLKLSTQEIERYQKKLREEGACRSRLSRYVDQTLVEKIINSEYAIPLPDTRQEVTMLFADIRSFTAISEHMSPEEVIGMLNDYFEEMVKIIFKHQGVLDKFVGDGLMATFGVVGEPQDGPLHAMQAAIAMQARVASLMPQFQQKKYPQFEVGIGINTGEVVMGNVGSKNRMDYTVIGDTVNVASRLEQMSSGQDIIVGEETYKRCQAYIPMKAKGEIKLKNRSAPVKCYEVSK